MSDRELMIKILTSINNLTDLFIKFHEPTENYNHNELIFSKNSENITMVLIKCNVCKTYADTSNIKEHTDFCSKTNSIRELKSMKQDIERILNNFPRGGKEE